MFNQIITDKMVGKTIAEAFPTMQKTVIEQVKDGVYDPTPKEIADKAAIEAAKPPICPICLVKWNAEKGIK